MRALLITIDTLRADHLGCYGYFRDTSPTMDLLARDGVVFNYCISSCAHTTPSFTTMVSGQEPFNHGVVATLHAAPNENVAVLNDFTPTLAELLWMAGIRTWAVDNLIVFPCHPKWFVRGYQYYINPAADPMNRQADLTADEVNEKLLPWLRQCAASHFFGFVHYWDAHRPYNQPDEFQTFFNDSYDDSTVKATPAGVRYVPLWGRKEWLDEQKIKLINQYDGEIRYVDDRIGQVVSVLKKCGIYDETMIIITADHGEDMAEYHCHFGHREPYDAVVRVPMIIKLPRDLPTLRGQTVDGFVRHADLLPTLLELAGAERVPTLRSREDEVDIGSIDGRSLIPLLRGEDYAFPEEVFAIGSYVRIDGRWYTVEMAVRTQDYKLITRSRVPERDYTQSDVSGLIPIGAYPCHEPGKERKPQDVIFNELPLVELYDMQQDPCEMHNIADEMPDVVPQLQRKLKGMRESQHFLKQ